MSTRPEHGPGPDVPTNPWPRYGLVMAGVWLVFLAFPVSATLRSPAPAWARGLALPVVAAFALAYLRGLSRCWAFHQQQVAPRSVRWLLVLVALALASAPVLGLEAIGLAPFVAAFVCYAFPLRHAAGLGLLTVATALGVPAAAGRLGDWVGLGLVTALVVLGSLANRWATERGEDYDRDMERLRLAEERERVARDVHDVLGHTLTVVAVKTELAERLLDVDVDRARTELAEVRTLTRTALAEVRETVGGLRVAALADEIDSARMALAGAGIEATLPTDLTVVDPRHRTVLAWVLREAVTNVVRHSGARRCQVLLGPASLVVEDDGRGMRAGKEGNGIRGLRERVAGVGGGLSLAPGAGGRGTRLEVRL